MNNGHTLDTAQHSGGNQQVGKFMLQQLLGPRRRQMYSSKTLNYHTLLLNLGKLLQDYGVVPFSLERFGGKTMRLHSFFVGEIVRKIR